MLERRLRAVVLASLTICLLPACQHFTASGRQQLAYAHYVQKQSHNRVKMQTKYKKMKIPAATAAEPKITGTSEGPRSVTSAPATTSSQEAPQQAPPPSEPENQ
jgi:hypothetical protein